MNINLGYDIIYSKIYKDYQHILNFGINLNENIKLQFSNSNYNSNPSPNYNSNPSPNSNYNSNKSIQFNTNQQKVCKSIKNLLKKSADNEEKSPRKINLSISKSFVHKTP